MSLVTRSPSNREEKYVREKRAYSDVVLRKVGVGKEGSRSVV